MREIAHRSAKPSPLSGRSHLNSSVQPYAGKNLSNFPGASQDQVVHGPIPHVANGYKKRGCLADAREHLFFITDGNVPISRLLTSCAVWKFDGQRREFGPHSTYQVASWNPSGHFPISAHANTLHGAVPEHADKVYSGLTQGGYAEQRLVQSE